MAEEKAKYKIRRNERLNGHGPKPRDTMPWWYEAAMADFAQREREQAEAAKRGPLSANPMQPWGNPKAPRSRLDSDPDTGRLERR